MNGCRRLPNFHLAITNPLFAILGFLFLATAPLAAGSFWKVNYRALVSAADLNYASPVSRSEAGQPVGNGRMGSLVWTTPTALKFQINRDDVFAENSNTHSFPARHSDYMPGCGYVDINFVEYGHDVFAGRDFNQHLAVYDGLETVKGQGITARVLAWPQEDVMAVEIDDQRRQPQPITIDLRMLRYQMEYFPRRNYELATNHAVMVRHRNQTATSRLDIQRGRILLTQEFAEGNYYDSSAVAIAIVGRKSQARYLNSSTVQLAAAPGRGKFVILISSSASFNQVKDAVNRVMNQLDDAEAKPFSSLLADTENWWHDFWSRGFVALHSADGEADFVARNYTYFLYVMGASSRGNYPPRFGGMLWNTTGGMQEWGSQFWWNNMDCYYGGLMPANRPELYDPLFDMYFEMYDACARTAREVWGSKGIYIPETGFFNGPENLPPAIADEMRQLYLGRKPWTDRSAAFMRYAATKNPHNSLWNWIAKGSWVDGTWEIEGRHAGPHGPVVGIFQSGAKIAFLFWERYEFTQDKAWLRDRAYPMLKGIAEFYRNYPGTQRGPDGKWHIHNVNNSEGIWGATDSQEDLSAMRGIFSAAIRASEILNVDSGLRAKWKSFVADLAPLPMNARGDWVVARPPTVHGNPNMLGLTPAIYYDLCTASTTNPAILKAANRTYDVIRSDSRWWHSASANAPEKTSAQSGETSSHFDPKTPVSVLSPIATIAAHLGRAEDLRYILPNQIRCLHPQGDFCDWTGSGKAGVLPNRLTLREGPGAIGAERLGRIVRGVNDGLVQSAPPMPGGEPVITVFPAWPKEWDAEFSLLARGAFLVSSARVKGQIPFVEIRSEAGSPCHLVNPWPDTEVTLYRDRKPVENLSGRILSFLTEKGETVIVAPKGAKLSSVRAPAIQSVH